MQGTKSSHWFDLEDFHVPMESSRKLVKKVSSSGVQDCCESTVILWISASSCCALHTSLNSVLGCSWWMAGLSEIGCSSFTAGGSSLTESAALSSVALFSG